MRGDQLELELLSKEVRRRAGLADDEVELATRIAARLLGQDAIAVDPTLGGAAYLRQADDGWQIVVRPGARDVRFHVAHEIGEWALRAIANFTGTAIERERAANYLAAAILAPENVLRAAHADIEQRLARAPERERLRQLALRFGLSSTSVVLRLAEVNGDERGVVTKTGNVILRTQGSFPWTEVPILEVARGEARWAGIAKAKLRGGIDEGRVALRVR